MATKLKRLCRYNRCASLTNDKSGYCDKHRSQSHIDYRKSRTDIVEQKFYNSIAWRTLSARLRITYPICQECKVNASKTVHHIKEIKRGGDKLAVSNLICLCDSCHAYKHR